MKSLDLLREYNRLGGPMLAWNAVRSRLERILGLADESYSGANIRLNESEYEVAGGFPNCEWVQFGRNVLMPEVTRCLREHFEVADNKVFVDIGASAGDTALYADSLGARTVAFEANPGLYELLKSNIDRNGANVDPRLIAIGNQIGEADIETVIGKTRGDYEQKLDEIDTISTATVDSVVDSAESDVELVKIDIDGAEYRALQGAKKTIGSVPILLELHHTGILGKWEETVEYIFNNSNRVEYLWSQGNSLSEFEYGTVLYDKKNISEDKVTNLLIL